MKALLSILALASISMAEIPTVVLPHVFAVDSTPKVRYVYENDTVMANRIIQLKDSVNADTTKTLIKSLGSLRVTLDNDNNATGQKLAITNNGAADTLLKVGEDSIRSYRPVKIDSGMRIGKILTVSDSILGTSARLTGALNLADSIRGASARLTGSIAADTLLAPKLYTEGSFTASLLGCTTVPTATARYVRIGKQVTLYFPAFGTCTSNQTYLVIDGAPNAIAAARGQYFYVLGGVIDNGTAYEGLIDTQLGTPQQFAISRKTALATYPVAFTGSGTKGLDFPITITYTLQ